MALPAGHSRIIFVGASTGGTEALRDVLLGVPADAPPILIVQHMPAPFTTSFSRRLDAAVAPHVVEARGGETLAPGMVYVAPGSAHLRVARAGAGWQTMLDAGAPVNRHRPSVDVLFDSAVDLGQQAVGVLLTGMGKDGALGLLRMRNAGARTLAQDEASCVVYGMPREAVRVGAVERVVPLSQMARAMLDAART